MKTHTTAGLEIINEMLNNFRLQDLPFAECLRNIVYCHHEFMDGSGYLDGLQGEQIPLEARIVTTADIFDALTSQRPYKEAWDNDEALEVLLGMTRDKLDKRCVEVLASHLDQVESIQNTFRENYWG